jgi:hypothetical protein
MAGADLSRSLIGHERALPRKASDDETYVSHFAAKDASTRCLIDRAQ